MLRWESAMPFRRLLIGALFASLTAAAGASSSRAETGTLRLEVSKVGFIVGAGRGNGRLLFQGERYPLAVTGLSLGATIGISTTELVGHAYNLRTAADIAGTYKSVGRGFALTAGRGRVRLQNKKGVVIELSGRKAGFELAANVGGVEIKLR